MKKLLVYLLIISITTASQLICSTSYSNWYKNKGNSALTHDLIHIYAPQFFQRMEENNYEVDYGSLVYTAVFGTTKPGEKSRPVTGYKAAVLVKESEGAESIRYEIQGNAISVDDKFTVEDIFDVC